MPKKIALQKDDEPVIPIVKGELMVPGSVGSDRTPSQTMHDKFNQCANFLTELTEGKTFEDLDKGDYGLVLKLLNVTAIALDKLGIEEPKEEGAVSRMEQIREMSVGANAVIVGEIVMKNRDAFIEQGFIDEKGSVIDPDGYSREIQRIRSK